MHMVCHMVMWPSSDVTCRLPSSADPLQRMVMLAFTLFLLGMFLMNAHIGDLHQQDQSSFQNSHPCSLRFPLQVADCLTSGISSNTPHGKDKKHMLTVLASGRLGNQMFQYASLLGIAHKNQRVAFISSKLEIVRYFSGLYVDDRPLQGWQQVTEDQYAVCDPRMNGLPLANIKLHGFLQSWHYFTDITTEVRRAFQLKRPIQKQLKTFFHMHIRQSMKNITKNTRSVIKIGVHVRRADMLDPREQARGYECAPLSYLLKALQYMRSKFGGQSIFFVVSDDLEWCKKNLDGEDVQIVAAAAPVIHLGFLGMCDHVIMTVGTFGWWGAFLSGGHVVYYDGYPRHGSEMAKGFQSTDFFFPQWVPIGA